MFCLKVAGKSNIGDHLNTVFVETEKMKAVLSFLKLESKSFAVCLYHVCSISLRRLNDMLIDGQQAHPCDQFLAWSHRTRSRSSFCH